MPITVFWAVVLENQDKYVWWIIHTHYISIYNFLEYPLVAFNDDKVVAIMFLFEVKFKVIHESVHFTSEALAFIDLLQNCMDGG